MWPRTHLLLVLVRLFFALSPSYLHPDEHFQGPEVIAGEIFSYPVRRTWEFTSSHPIRSVFPLWPVYGLPMLLLRWLWIGKGGDGDIPPVAVFWTLRVLMFALSFVLEDWALHELIRSPRHRHVAVLLVASSYVTWTYQTHTFSNSIETLAVAWSLVLIKKIDSRVSALLRSSKRGCSRDERDDEPDATLLTNGNGTQQPSLLAATLLGIVGVFGIFNRITFPAFLIIPGLRLIPLFLNRPLALATIIAAGLATACTAVIIDTAFYSPEPLTWTGLLARPVVTPLNNFLYNMSTENLARHGLHPWYQHIIGNMPLLIGPAAVILLTHPHLSIRLYSALSGVAVLSCFRHQEARFLLPTVPLILSSIRLPTNPTVLKGWVVSWVGFNAFMGVFMGVYHQGGVVPGQVFLSAQADATDAVWWQTYTPPIWLLDGKNEVLQTHDVMGMPLDVLLEELGRLATCHTPPTDSGTENTSGTYLVAPSSAKQLDTYLSNEGPDGLQFHKVWQFRRHLNLDDVDFGEDGVWGTLTRVIGRRGLAIFRVTKRCEE